MKEVEYILNFNCNKVFLFVCDNFKGCYVSCWNVKNIVYGDMFVFKCCKLLKWFEFSLKRYKLN